MKPSHSQKKQFRYGSFEFDYEYIQQDRKTLSLTITPELKIIIKAPYSADNNRVDQFLKRKWRWLQKQIHFFNKFQVKTYEKEYVSGESIYYLGKQYKLLVRFSNENNVELQKKIVLVHTPKSQKKPSHIKKLVSEWLDRNMQRVLSERFETIKAKFGYQYEIKLSYKDMKNKWGIFYSKNKIALNPKLIHVSKTCIDYVITHELNHIKNVNHDKKFLLSMNKIMPKWEAIKARLEEQGAQVTN